MIGSAVERLAAAGCVAAEEEAAELAAAAADEEMLAGWIGRREAGEPLAWIVGSVEFCGRRVRVDPGVFVPRAQSEDLARRAALLLTVGPGRGADLCTGSGAIAAHLMREVPGSTVVGIDADVRAVRCARSNGVRTVVADVRRAPLRRSFDVITAVAPYVPTSDLRLLPADVRRHEPRRALDGGDDGLDVVRLVVAAAAGALRPGGWLLTEVGGRQDVALAPTLRRCGFEPAETWCDEDGDLRGIASRYAGQPGA